MSLYEFVCVLFCVVESKLQPTIKFYTVYTEFRRFYKKPSDDISLFLTKSPQIHEKKNFFMNYY